MITADDIIALRKFRTWSQKDLGDRIGATQGTVSRIEGGAKIDRPYEIILEGLITDFRAEEAELQPVGAK